MYVPVFSFRSPDYSFYVSKFPSLAVHWPCSTALCSSLHPSRFCSALFHSLPDTDTWLSFAVLRPTSCHAPHVCVQHALTRMPNTDSLSFCGGMPIHKTCRPLPIIVWVFQHFSNKPSREGSMNLRAMLLMIGACFMGHNAVISQQS